jgi:hypothetical protein
MAKRSRKQKEEEEIIISDSEEEQNDDIKRKGGKGKSKQEATLKKERSIKEKVPLEENSTSEASGNQFFCELIFIQIISKKESI